MCIRDSYYAAQNGQLSVLRYLIKEKQCDPMCGGKDGWTVLHVAAFLGDLQVVQYLIDKCGVDLMSCRDEDGDTLLHYAAQIGQLSVLRYLIKEKQCDPMCGGRDGRTVLHVAASHSHLQVVQYLIDECGVDPKSCWGNDGDTLLHYVAQKGQLSVQLSFLSNIVK